MQKMVTTNLTTKRITRTKRCQIMLGGGGGGGGKRQQGRMILLSLSSLTVGIIKRSVASNACETTLLSAGVTWHFVSSFLFINIRMLHYYDLIEIMYACP